MVFETYNVFDQCMYYTHAMYLNINLKKSKVISRQQNYALDSQLYIHNFYCNILLLLYI